MKTKILLVTLLVFIRRLTINGMELEKEDIEQVQQFVYLLCEYPTPAIRASIFCHHSLPTDEKFGKQLVKYGDFGAVIFADVFPTRRVTVEELTLPEDWEMQPGIEPTRERKEWQVEVAIKVWFERIKKIYAGTKFPTVEKERRNAMRLAAWKIGPKVYNITVKGNNSVSFEDYVVLEYIDGWTLHDLFVRWIDKIAKLPKPVDYDTAVTFVKKRLNMQIAYMEGFEQVWSRGYRHCDAHSGNAMMRAASEKECEQIKESHGDGEHATFDVIGKKCVIWDKKYLALLDSGFMVKVKNNATEPVCKALRNQEAYRVSDMYRLIGNWIKMKSEVMKHLPNIPLLNAMDKVIRDLPMAMHPTEEYEWFNTIFEGLRNLQRGLSVYSNMFASVHRNVKKKVPPVHRKKYGTIQDVYKQVFQDLRKWRGENDDPEMILKYAKKWGEYKKGGKDGHKDMKNLLGREHGENRSSTLETSITEHAHWSKPES